MQAERVRLSSSIAVGAVSVAFAADALILASHGHTPSPELSRVYPYFVQVLLAGWFVSDFEIQRQYSPSFDHGWFVSAYFPFYSAYHLFATRRWRGLGICGLMVVAVAVPWLVELIAHYVS